MFLLKRILIMSPIVVLGACSLTQPKAPIFSGFDNVTQNTPIQRAVTSQKPQYKIVEEVVETKEKVYHTVKDGDYVWALGRQYDVSPFTIIKQNNLQKPYTLTNGQKLYIKQEVKKEVIKKRELVTHSTMIPAQDRGYSLTNNPKLYNQNTPENRMVTSIPRQDFSKPNNDKNIDFGYHDVKRGENLFRIGRKYGVSVFDLMAYNDLKSPEDLQAGTELKIPVAKKDVAVESGVDKKSSYNGVVNYAKIDKEMAKKKGFIYPVKGKVIETYGKKGHGIRNDGVDIAVKIGTPVRAAQSGTVQYAQNVSVLGNMVLIKHANGYLSAYTHNSKLLAKKGDRVAKGQIIALSGDSGNAKQPMLHFELRRYGKALDPAKYLH